MAAGPYRLRIVDDESLSCAELARQATPISSPASSGIDWHNQSIRCIRVAVSHPMALRTKYFQDLLGKCILIDPLTELPNRRAMKERLAQEWARLLRYGGWGKEKG